MNNKHAEHRILLITLSNAEHLLDESTHEWKLVFAGPRFATDRNHLKTGKSPTISSIITHFCKQNIKIAGILVYADIFSLAQFRPINDTKDISTICVVGDTHHGQNPITKLAKWLIQSNIGTIALKQTVSHANIFEEIGFRVIKLPYYAHNVPLIEPKEHYFERVIFAGSIGPNHAKRTYYLNTLKAHGIPIDICRLPRQNTFKAYNSYACAFNMPLNGDINYRIWEIMAAGSVCLTEKIEDATEKDLLCKSGISILTYSDIDDCCSKINTIIKNPSIRMKIAKEGYKQICNAKNNSLNLRILTESLSTHTPQRSSSFQIRKSEADLQYKLACAQLYEENQRKLLELGAQHYFKNIRT